MIAITTCNTVGSIARSRNCRVIQRGVGEDIFLGHQAWRSLASVRGSSGRGRHRRGGSIDRIADALRGIAAWREELRVVEADRRAAGDQREVMLEIQAAGRSRRAVADRMARVAAPRSLPCSTIVIPGDAADRLHEQLRCCGMVHVHDGHAKAPHHGGAEGQPSRPNAITGTPKSRKRATGSRRIQRTSRAG